MHKMIQKYIASCHTCWQAKASHETYNGLLKPLPVLDQKWKDISVDFIVDLPASKVVTDLIYGLVDLLSLKTQAVWYTTQKGFDPIKL